MFARVGGKQWDKATTRSNYTLVTVENFSDELTIPKATVVRIAKEVTEIGQDKRAG
jgi:hypothetical protein